MTTCGDLAFYAKSLRTLSTITLGMAERVPCGRHSWFVYSKGSSQNLRSAWPGVAIQYQYQKTNWLLTNLITPSTNVILWNRKGDPYIMWTKLSNIGPFHAANCSTCYMYVLFWKIYQHVFVTIDFVVFINVFCVIIAEILVHYFTLSIFGVSTNTNLYKDPFLLESVTNVEN